jgi:saccharopine dehydrogenase-like NADP-dependent oxidoreductase
MRIHCLGGGLVGLFVTRRLVNSNFEVHLFDIEERDTEAIFHLGSALEQDHSAADLIINMLPGHLGNKATESLKNTGQRIVDLSFSETTPDNLQNVNSSILWDVGIAPGLSNMLVALAYREFGNLDSVSIKVGGNPSQPDDEWSYMAPFSPHDVIAEYTRPARIIENGEPCEVPAMSELHSIDANGRAMEAFLTDGLRSLLNIPATKMGEYTVRWPGHIQRYQQSKLDPDELVDAWKLDPSREEFTWMEVHITSGENERKWIIEDDGCDGDSSMARTTGLVTACCAIAWVDRPEMLSPGVHAPEDLPDEVIELVIEVMRSEGVSIELQP